MRGILVLLVLAGCSVHHVSSDRVQVSRACHKFVTEQAPGSFGDDEYVGRLGGGRWIVMGELTSEGAARKYRCNVASQGHSWLVSVVMD